jgi:hypothetical protein
LIDILKGDSNSNKEQRREEKSRAARRTYAAVHFGGPLLYTEIQ